MGLCVLAVVSADSLGAQSIVGRVVDDQTGAPVPAAVVAVLDRDQRSVRSVLADSAGVFRAGLRSPGRYHLRGEGLGYVRTTSPPLDVREGEVVEVELRLAVDAIPLAPLVVVSDRPALILDATLERRGYYERQSMWGPLGAHYLDQEEMRERHPWTLEGVLRSLADVRVEHVGARGVSVTDRRGRALTVCLDGMRLGRWGGDLSVDQLVPRSTILAVEVYASSAVRRLTPCSVMIWTGVVETARD